jgi:hypothetical protein
MVGIRRALGKLLRTIENLMLSNSQVEGGVMDDLKEVMKYLR